MAFIVGSLSIGRRGHQLCQLSRFPTRAGHITKSTTSSCRMRTRVRSISQCQIPSERHLPQDRLLGWPPAREVHASRARSRAPHRNPLRMNMEGRLMHGRSKKGFLRNGPAFGKRKPPVPNIRNAGTKTPRKTRVGASDAGRYGFCWTQREVGRSQRNAQNRKPRIQVSP